MPNKVEVTSSNSHSPLLCGHVKKKKKKKKDDKIFVFYERKKVKEREREKNEFVATHTLKIIVVLLNRDQTTIST
jgi:hypothetical protein